MVVLEHEAEIVGPELDEGGEARDPEHAQDERRDDAAEGEEERVGAPVRLRRERDRPRRKQGNLPPLDEAVAEDGEQRRHQQYGADDGEIGRATYRERECQYG